MKTNWILNEDNSIYHLRLKPGDLSDTIITVGDPDRVNKVAKYFDRIELEVHSREFKTITGFVGKTKLSVISTGIGTDNIDIVFNEIDALFNLNLETGEALPNIQSLRFIRLGTSGAVREEIPVDSLLLSEWSLGLDGLLPFYANHEHFIDLPLKLKNELHGLSGCFVFKADEALIKSFENENFIKGCTLTASGFYAPQGRLTRIKTLNLLNGIRNWPENIGPVTNIEMETSAIYGLSKLMGHKAISLSAILANRITGEFSSTPEKTIEKLIGVALEKISGFGN